MTTTASNILGLSNNYTLDDVKKAYKTLALTCHPDKINIPAWVMQQINEAYAELLAEFDNSNSQQTTQQLQIKTIQRLTKKDFIERSTIRAKVIYGEVFPGEILWSDYPDDVNLVWSDKCMITGKPGIQCEIGEFSGYENGIYHRYSFPSEHCMKILKFYE